MTRLIACLGIVAMLVAAGPWPSAAASRRCRRTCRPAIAACTQNGGGAKSCRRSILRSCRRNPGICDSTFPTTTTTTLPYGFPSGTVGLDVETLETLYEVGLLVPAPDSEFVRVQVRIRNGSTAAA